MAVKVGFWAPSFRTGGSEVWCISLFRSLDLSRVRLTGMGVLDSRYNDRYMLDLASKHLPVHTGPEGMTRVASECDVLVMWAVQAPGQYLPNPRPRTVLVSHADGNWKWWADRQRAASPWVDRYVAVSEPARTSVPRNRRDECVVIPNCVNPMRPDPEARRELRKLWGFEDRRVLLTMSRLQAEKAPLAAFETVRLLPDVFVAVLAGDGPLAPAARKHVADGGGRCLWIGQRRDVARVYSAADYYVNGAPTEGFGLSMAEAMLCELPVVAARGLGLLAAHPGLAGEAEGPAPELLAAALLRDEGDRAGTAARAATAREVVAREYAEPRFGRLWAELLESL